MNGWSEGSCFLVGFCCFCIVVWLVRVVFGGEAGEREDGLDDHPNALFTHSFQNVGVCVLLGWMSCEFLVHGPVDQACLVAFAHSEKLTRQCVAISSMAVKHATLLCDLPPGFRHTQTQTHVHYHKLILIVITTHHAQASTGQKRGQQAARKTSPPRVHPSHT